MLEIHNALENRLNLILDKLSIALRLKKTNRPLNIIQGKRQQNFKLFDQNLREVFGTKQNQITEKYNYLFVYLLTGFKHYQSKVSSLVYYNGIPSFYDRRVQAMEGFSRFLPVICAWLASGRPKQLQLLSQEAVDLEEIVMDGLLAGTDPSSPGYWGEMVDYDQRICEAAILALSICMVRDSLWQKFSNDQKKQIIKYLLKANGKKVTDNNWNIFPVWINIIAKHLGFDHDEQAIPTHFTRVKSFYRGEGWFTDGIPKGKERFDYYNVFIFNFFLFWLTVFDPGFESQFIQEALEKFIEKYVYLMTPEGVPYLGRSIPYRMALAAPLIVGCKLDHSLTQPGLARRAFDTLMTHFITRGAIAYGNVSQGYYQTDLRWLDRYIGPASGLLSLFSFALALSCHPDSPFWTAPEMPLPVEKGDYRIFIPSINWEIIGLNNHWEIIIKNGKGNVKVPKIANYTILHLMAEKILRRPFRPQNWSAKYDLGAYTSKNPLWSVAN
ncbi:MAG: DUF2264 domain-containing protein [Desulfobacca sp.]|nr:DUF2264 domain-containing protein [Desulfobacca sp.]